jgi:hypothetical protein
MERSPPKHETEDCTYHFNYPRHHLGGVLALYACSELRITMSTQIDEKTATSSALAV